jgi:hypothetical protein
MSRRILNHRRTSRSLPHGPVAAVTTTTYKAWEGVRYRTPEDSN